MVPGADGVTVAVSVTDVPACWGVAGEAVSVVVVVCTVGTGKTTDQVLAEIGCQPSRRRSSGPDGWLTSFTRSWYLPA